MVNLEFDPLPRVDRRRKGLDTWRNSFPGELIMPPDQPNQNDLDGGFYMTIRPEMYATLAGGIDNTSFPRIIDGLTEITHKGTEILHLMIQSTGGMVGEGVSLHNFFLNYPIELHLYNTGTVASIAAVAFLGARKRYADANAIFMLHRSRVTLSTPRTAKQLRATSTLLDLDDKRTEAILRANSTIPPEVWAALDDDDVFFSATEALKFGFIHEIKPFVAPVGEKLFHL